MLAARGGGDEFIERGLERRADRRPFQQDFRFARP